MPRLRALGVGACNAKQIPHRGESETRQLIVLYTVLLVALTLMPVVFGYFGLIYGAAAVVLGGVFISLSLRLWRERYADSLSEPASAAGSGAGSGRGGSAGGR